MDEAHFKALKAAAGLYHDALTHPTTKNTATTQQALAFLHARGITDVAIKHWRIGYADGTQLERHLRAHDLPIPKALEVGLFYQPHRPGSLFREVMQGRITFPMVLDGRVEFIAGRATQPTQQPKYLGLSIPKPLYYDGLDAEVLEHDQAILVEGPLDLITLWQWGYHRQYALIALIGTAIKSEALTLFERFGRIVLALDADTGGQRAMQKLVALWPERAHIVPLPDGQDVNDLAQQPDGRARFAQWLQAFT
jgi:DNA primase